MDEIKTEIMILRNITDANMAELVNCRHHQKKSDILPRKENS